MRSPNSTTSTPPPGRLGRRLATVSAASALALVGAACESDDEPIDDPAGTLAPGPADVDDDGSTTSSLPGPGYTAPPNDDAGGGGAPGTPAP